MVLVVHSTCTLRTLWLMNNTNRRRGIVKGFEWAVVVFIVYLVFPFLMSWEFVHSPLGSTNYRNPDPDLNKHASARQLTG